MISISNAECIGCGLCVKECFPKNITMSDDKAISKNRLCIECGHCVAVCPSNAIILENYPSSEIIEHEKGAFEIDADQYLRFLKFKRTIRQFTGKQVEREKIEKIIQAGRYSPTGGNLQNVSYIIMKNDVDALRNFALEELNNMANLSKEEKEKMNVSWYARMWKQMYKEYHGEDKKDGLFFHAQTVILVVSPSVQNGCIAAAHMETMVYAQGLGMVYSGFFTRAVACSSDLKEYIGLKDDQQVVACLVVGYPNVEYKRTVPRKEAGVVWR